MAVISSTKDFWIHPEGLTLSINFFGDPQLIQSSLLAGAIVMAYRKDVIDYDAAHNFREWKLQAFPTQLSDTCVYYVHIELSRTGNTAMVIYSPVKRDMQGRSFVDDEWDDNTSEESWFIYIGTLSASVDDEGNTVERAWTDGIYTGTLATDQYRMEETSGDWTKMFSLNNVTGLIDVLKTISSVTINALTVAKNFVFGGKTLTGIAASEDSGEDDKINDATLPTTGYVEEEIKSLDDHFLIKDENISQSVAGPVEFKHNVDVLGKQTVGIEGSDGRVDYSKEVQEIKGVQVLHGGFRTPNFTDAAGQYVGAQLTADGIMTVAGLRAMSFEVMELIYNRIRAIGGKLSLSETGVIEACSYVLTDDRGEITPEVYYAEGSPYTLSDIAYVSITFKEDEHNKGLIEFTHNDIIYGYVNQIGASGQYARGGQCCMYVLSTNEEIGKANAEEDGYKKMTIKAILFSDEKITDESGNLLYDGVITDESGNPLYDKEGNVVGNMAPTAGMALAHRGNINSDYPERMTSVFMDSSNGNIVLLQNVDTPTISKDNYGAIIGKLPTDLFEEVQDKFAYIQPYDPITYAKYGIFENLLRFDHQRNPIKDEVYRGAWSQAIANGKVDGEEQYRLTDTVYHTVTHKGSLWKCNADRNTTEPALGIGEWTMLVAKGEDSSVANYTILANPNTFYFDTTTAKPSVDRIQIKIGETTASGYIILDDQSALNARNLSVSYSVDGGALTPFSIGTSSVYALEDGSGIIATEDDEGLWIEADDFDATSIKNDITVYLTDAESKVLALCVIPFVKAGSFKSTVFIRSATDPDTPKGGTYDDPIPTDKDENDVLLWSDGIPDGTETIYSSSCTFYGNGTSSGWSDPVKMADTADFEVMYSPNDFASASEAKKALTIDGIPFSKNGVNIDPDWLAAANKNGWYDDDMIGGQQFKALWMATNHRRTGDEWADAGWVVTKTEGEKGDDGTSVNANIIPNANFVENGWDVMIGEIIKNAYMNYNAFVADEVQAEILAVSVPTLKEIGSYVLSFYTKADYASPNVRFRKTDGSLWDEDCIAITGGENVQTPRDTNGYSFGIPSGSGHVWLKVTAYITVTQELTEDVFLSFYRGRAGITNSILVINQPKIEVGDKPTMFIPSELTGPAGEAGPMMYPQGTWDANVKYTRTADTCPFVHYTDDNYYYLIADSAEGDAQSPAMGTPYWRAMTTWEAIYTNFLMANWALFGGANGGVFYKGYLFSQQGITNKGEPSLYGDHKTDMWDEDGNLSGMFNPNFFVDFLRGALKTNRLSETFKEFDYTTPCNILNTEDSYNISAMPGVPLDKNNPQYVGRMLSMPLVNNIYDGEEIIVSKAPWEPNGMKCTVLVRENDAWNKLAQAAEMGKHVVDDTHGVTVNMWKNCLTSGAVLCADARVIDQRSYRLNKSETDIEFAPGSYNTYGESLDTAQYGGFFVVKGKLAKFIFVEPGTMVRLRSCSAALGLEGSPTDTLKMPLWYVENSDDFEEVEATVTTWITHVYTADGVIALNLEDSEDWDSSLGRGWSWGHYTAGTSGTEFSFKNYAFATKGIAAADAVAKGTYGENSYKSNVNIYTYSTYDETSCESNIEKIEQSQLS